MRGAFDSLLAKSMQPHQVHIPDDPPPVIDSVLVNKIVPVNALTEASIPYVFDVGTIMANVSGGTTYWSRVRIEKIQIWGLAEDGPLIVQVPTDNGWDQPPIEWEDTATPGATRTKIAFKLGLLDRTRWFQPTSEQVLFSAMQSGASQSQHLTIHVSVSLMSPIKE